MTTQAPAPASPGDDIYENLPQSVRDGLPKWAWMWLSDAEKARLVQNETEPEA